METAQFDHLACRVATRSSRRGLLSVLAGAGVLAKFGLDESPQRASAEGTCTLDLIATARLGPNAGQFLWAGGTQPGQIHGRLTFGISTDGILAGAALQLDDGSSLPAVGQATGYALQARIALGDARALMLTGVGEQPIATCRGVVSGLLSGPQPGDLGDWQATASGSASGAAVPTSVSAPAPTPPQEPAGSGCSEGLIRCGQYCANLSSDPANCGYCGVQCSQATSCIDGSCIELDGCLDGLAHCSGGCFDLNNDHYHCGSCDVQCSQVESCVAGVCFEAGVGTNDGCPGGTIHCPGAVCVDLLSDPENCGACSMACGQGQTCWGGVCTKVDNCAGGLTNCGGVCVDILSDPLNCSGCSTWCGEDQVCSGGMCVRANHKCKGDGQPCNGADECCSGYCSNGGSVCFTPACLEVGAPCLVNWDCCSGICNTFDYSYTCDDLMD